ncbi:hypothetical protein BU15DRAFT_65655 [Melanogaster broomeanus]|nr:hypothetical protein BU15DRAFT_65655 [Melanogaster broomeanus]
MTEGGSEAPDCWTTETCNNDIVGSGNALWISKSAGGKHQCPLGFAGIRRSPAQKNHIGSLQAQIQATKENLPAPISNPPSPANAAAAASNNDTTINTLTNSKSDQLKELGKSLRNTLRREKHAKQRVETARKQAREAQTKNRQLSARAEASRRRLEELEQRNDVLADRNQALTKRLSRVPVQTQRAVQKAVSAATSRAAPLGLTLKQGGIITDEARDMVRELVAIHDVPVSSVNGVVEAVSCAAGLEVRGSLSVRSVGRIMLEGMSPQQCRWWMRLQRLKARVNSQCRRESTT